MASVPQDPKAPSQKDCDRGLEVIFAAEEACLRAAGNPVLYWTAESLVAALAKRVGRQAQSPQFRALVDALESLDPATRQTVDGLLSLTPEAAPGA